MVASPSFLTPTEQIVTFSRYEDAQAAVDRLSDRGFPVETLSIVWSDLRRVERVTGRRTVGRAFLEGLVTGAWFGVLLGLLLVLFVDVEGSGEFWLVVWYAVVAALAVGAFRAVTHLMQRGKRDFAAVGYLDAAQFQVWCRAEVAGRAREELDIQSRRPIDPVPPPSEPR